MRHRHPRILDRKKAVLLIVDVQEGFRKVLKDFTELAKNIGILIEAAKILDLPVAITEQYPRGLGHTVSELSSCLGQHQYFEKLCFSSMEEPLSNWLKESGRGQIILSGIEAHVCVNQTAHDLLQQGYQVHLITDAVTSRIPANKRLGIEKVVGSGALPSSVEMALFEMLETAGTKEFKAVQQLVK